MNTIRAAMQLSIKSQPHPFGHKIKQVISNLNSHLSSDNQYEMISNIIFHLTIEQVSFIGNTLHRLLLSTHRRGGRVSMLRSKESISSLTLRPSIDIYSNDQTSKSSFDIYP